MAKHALSNRQRQQMRRRSGAPQRKPTGPSLRVISSAQVEETADIGAVVAVQEAAGHEFAVDRVGPGQSKKRYRRKAGLEWLYDKKRIDKDQLGAGVRYGNLYRATMQEGLRSCLNDSVGGSRDITVQQVCEEANRKAEERRKLTAARAFLHFHVAMIAACDLICGQGKTPREINPGQRAAEEIEDNLKVALDLLIIFFS